MMGQTGRAVIGDIVAGERQAKVLARHLRNVQRQPERIRKYFQHDPVRHAA
jgi:hypothetical protein